MSRGRRLAAEAQRQVAVVKVVEAATAYVREVENPAPDYTLRRRLRDDMSAAVNEHERLIRGFTA